MAINQEFRVIETLYKDSEIAIERALRVRDALTVLLKSAVSKYPPIRIMDQFEHEYSLRNNLDSEWAIKPIELIKHADGVTLLLEDFTGIPINRAFTYPMNLLDFLKVSVAISSVIAKMHSASIIHKDINPRNILIDRSKNEIKLTGFRIAALTSEYQVTPNGVIEGDLPYISPEQAGRMNRPLDYRTDMYSLGITFYQMLTGSLPFKSEDPLELVYSHVAITPTPPMEMIPEIPKVVSDIIMKLISKVPDLRYQSALGLMADLDRCSKELEDKGHIDEFRLGAKDIPDRLQIPQKLYGREKQTALLLDTFERVATNGNPVLVMVSGYSGIGKSSLVRELFGPISERKGFFVSGKFDQYKRNIPYSTVVQAFQELIQQILTQTEGEIEVWRQKLQTALGINGQLVVDMIPQLELIIGPQSPVLELSPAESLNRFNYILRQFMGVFATVDHPVVAFLDDLQWADSASLKLMEQVMTDTETRYMMLVGAYRDNEVNHEHPMMRMLENVRRFDAHVEEIHLDAISFDASMQFVTDSLYSSEEIVRPLATLIYEKTGGNPFFMIHLLRTVSNQNLLWFDREKISWEWDFEKIRALGFTDNVADLMVKRLEGIPAESRDILKLASATGNQSDIHTLSLVSEKTEQELENELQVAVLDGLMLKSENLYKFAHDRIQQAAYFLIPEDKRCEVHLRIGELLLRDTADGCLEEKIFDIVNQFNQGLPAISDVNERNRVAELNLIAARKAKASTAYASAVEYLSTGISVLSDECWQSQYDLTYCLHIELAECEYLSGNFNKAEQLFPVILARANKNEDKAKVYLNEVYLHTTKGENDVAVDTALKCLQLFGIDLPKNPTKEQSEAEYNLVWENLGGRSIESLVDLPRMTDPQKIAVSNMLGVMMPPVFFTNENLRNLIGCYAVNFSLKYGNSDASSIGYLLFALTLGPAFNDYKTGYKFGMLALDFVDKYDIMSYKGKIYYDFSLQVGIWSRPINESVERSYLAYDILVAVGDINFACFCGNNLITLLRVNGAPLPEVYKESERQLAFAKKVKYQETVDIIVIMQQHIKCLQGLTYSLSTFSDDGFDEVSFEVYIQKHNILITVCWYYIWKLSVRFMAGDYAEAIKAARNAEPLLWTTKTAIHYAEYNYYYALALASIYDEVPFEEREEYFSEIVKIRTWLKERSDDCPENFLNCYLLVSAEVARISGDSLQAMLLYDQAIESAKEDGFTQNEGIGNELAARFYLKLGFETNARTYIRHARYAYQKWRAFGKVRQLDQLYPKLLQGAMNEAVSGTGLRELPLDVMTIVRSSQAISSEIDLSKLLNILMKTVIEQAGAENGYLLLIQDGELEINVESRIESGGIKVSTQKSLPSASILPLSILNYIIRTKETVLLNDATDLNPFSEDSYIKQKRPKSVLCLPIVRQTELIGVLYLENNLISGAFTQERVAILELLSSQAAISLQNAMEYMKRMQAEESLRELTQNLERRVIDRTSQLEAANRELEAFSYSVSHDLRSPLRRIDGFSQAILEDYGDQLNSEAQDYFQRIRESTNFMGQLIEDLLRLSRVTRTEMKHESVDLSSMAESIMKNLRIVNPERVVEVTVQPEVSAVGDADLLKIVLENLLNNAWKFTGKKPIGCIEFGSTHMNHEVIYFIKDNGAGFDMAYADKLFAPFQRLHDIEEFPGTGIGLAIVQRIIHRHGGRVWAEGKPDEGATFHFTLS